MTSVLTSSDFRVIASDTRSEGDATDGPGSPDPQVMAQDDPSFDPRAGGIKPGAVPVRTSTAERREAAATAARQRSEPTDPVNTGGFLGELEDILSGAAETGGNVLERAFNEAADVVEGALAGAKTGAEAGSRAGASDIQIGDALLAAVLVLILVSALGS